MKQTLCVMLALLLAPMALAEGEKSPEAIEILEKVDAAVKAVSGVACNTRAVPTGVATNFVSESEGKSVMIGDNLRSDIGGGTNYGIDTCWYNRCGATAGDGDRVTHEITALDQRLPLTES